MGSRLYIFQVYELYDLCIFLFYITVERNQVMTVEDVAQDRMKKMVKIATNRPPIVDKDNKSTIKLFSFGGTLYMKPSQSEMNVAKAVGNVTANSSVLGRVLRDTDAPNIATADAPLVQPSIHAQPPLPPEQSNTEEMVSAIEGYNLLSGNEVSATGNGTYQMEHNTTEAVTAPSETAGQEVDKSTAKGGHVVVVRDDGLKSGQRRQIICYIHGDLPSNITSDMTFIQQIIDKTKVNNVNISDVTSSSDDNAAQVETNDVIASTSTQTLDISDIDPQLAGIVYNVPTSVDSNCAMSLGLDTMKQDTISEDQGPVI